MRVTTNAPATRKTNPMALTAKNALDFPLRAFLTADAARAALAAIGAPTQLRAPKLDDDALIVSMQHIARESTLRALSGEQTKKELAARAHLVRNAEVHLKHAVKLLERVATMSGYEPPMIWRMREWKSLRDWFDGEAQRKRGIGRSTVPPARRWASSRLVVVYELAAASKATPGSGETEGPARRFVRAWRDGVRVTLGRHGARRAVDAVAPDVVDRKELAEAIAAMDIAPEAEAARWPAGTTVAWSPRREVTSWLPGGEFPLPNS